MVTRPPCPPVETQRADSLPHFAAQLMGACAVVALLLAAEGIYGILACYLSQRTALGAKAESAVRLVMFQGPWPIASGMANGWTSDPVALFLTTVALLASYIPAWQATRIDPMLALRPD